MAAWSSQALFTLICQRSITWTQNLVWDRSLEHIQSLSSTCDSPDFCFCFVFLVLSLFHPICALPAPVILWPFPNVFHLHLIAFFRLCSPHWSTCRSTSPCQNRLWEPLPLAARRLPLNDGWRCLIRHLWPNLLTRLRPGFPLPLNLFVLPC